MKMRLLSEEVGGITAAKKNSFGSAKVGPPRPLRLTPYLFGSRNVIYTCRVNCAGDRPRGAPRDPRRSTSYRVPGASGRASGMEKPASTLPSDDRQRHGGHARRQ